MHTLSKVLLGFAAVAAIAAIFLTSMLYDARNEWLKRVTTRQESVAQLEEDIRKKSLVVSDLESDVNRLMMNWGRSWELAPQNVSLLDPENGAVGLQLGLNDGLAVQESAAQQAGQDRLLPTIHLFGNAQDGTVSYLGAFRVTQVTPDQTAAELVRPPLPGEVDQWQVKAANGVRVWNNIPSSWLALNSKFQGEITEAQQTVQDEEGRLVTLEELNQKSQEQLARRMAELEGDNDPVEGASQDVIDGLVQTLRIEETTRNQQLQVLDQLRHEYHAKYNELIDLLQRNRNLEKQLPQPASDSNPLSIEPTAGRIEDGTTSR